MVRYVDLDDNYRTQIDKEGFISLEEAEQWAELQEYRHESTDCNEYWTTVKE